MKKVTRRLRNSESVRLLGVYLNDHFNNAGFPIRVTLEKWTPVRSNNQNSLMHGWFAEIAEVIGDDPKSVKSDLKSMFLPEVEGLHGVIRTKDTHELSTPEMSDFLHQIQALSSEMGWELTRP